MIEKEKNFEQRVILDPVSPPFREQEQFKFLFEDKEFWYGEHLDLVRCLINVYDTRHFIGYFYTNDLRITEKYKLENDFLALANEIDIALYELEKDIINNLKRFKENETK